MSKNVIKRFANAEIWYQYDGQKEKECPLYSLMDCRVKDAKAIKTALPSWKRGTLRFRTNTESTIGTTNLELHSLGEATH